MRNILLGLTILLLMLSCQNKNDVHNKKNPPQKPNSKTSDFKTSKNEQKLSQLEKFHSRTYPMEIISFSSGNQIDIAKDFEFKRPNHTTTNYFLSGYKDHFKEKEFDSNGVLMKNGNYHPTSIAKLALGSAMNYKETNSEQARIYLENQMKWIIDNFEAKENYGSWFFPFASPAYGLKKDWSSGYAHGLLLSALIEGYEISGDKVYKPIIDKAIKMYVVPQEYGGFKRLWSQEEWWFEEYATDRPSRVLNGHIFNLECLYNAYQDLKIPLLKELFEEGASTVLNHLEDYDAKYSSRYNLADWKNEIALENYHEIHILQLLWLYEATGNEKFKIYAKKFLESDRYDFLRRTNYFRLPPKIKNIVTSSNIDETKNGVDNLNNEIWAYGKSWSSTEEANLIFDFGEHKKYIKELTLYHTTAISKKINFKIFRYDEQLKDWIYVEMFNPKLNKDKISIYNKTGPFETFVEHFKIHEPLYGQKIKIVFKANKENPVSLRNVNFIYDRNDELNYLIKQTKKRIQERS